MGYKVSELYKRLDYLEEDIKNVWTFDTIKLSKEPKKGFIYKRRKKYLYNLNGMCVPSYFKISPHILQNKRKLLWSLLISCDTSPREIKTLILIEKASALKLKHYYDDIVLDETFDRNKIHKDLLNEKYSSPKYADLYKKYKTSVVRKYVFSFIFDPNMRDIDFKILKRYIWIDTYKNHIRERVLIDKNYIINNVPSLWRQFCYWAKNFKEFINNLGKEYNLTSEQRVRLGKELHKQKIWNDDGLSRNKVHNLLIAKIGDC